MIREFVRQFIQSAGDAGIEKLNFYMKESSSRNISVYGEKLEYLEHCNTSQLFVEGLVDGRAGCVFVENFDVSLIPDYLQAIQDTAAVCGKDFLPYELDGLQNSLTEDIEFTDLDSTLEAMCRASRTAMGVDNRIDEGIQVHEQESCYRYTLANERGQYAADVVRGGRAGIHLVAREDQLVQPGGKGRPFNTEMLPDLDDLARQAAEGAVSRLGASSCAGGNYPVVLDARVTAELLDAFMPAFFARNVHSRMSILAGRLGEQLTGENISILEDPFLEGGFCTRNFDDEGIATQAKAIVETGRLNCFLHNRGSAGVEGISSGGNGFKTQFNEAVSTGYTNVFIPKGEHSQEELLSMMGDGLLITAVSGVFAGAKPNSGDFSLISSGYLVEGGEIRRAVNQITIAGNFFEMLKHVNGIGNDEHWMIAPNGNVRTPSLYVQSLAISGKE